jgi:hypothetical protein
MPDVPSFPGGLFASAGRSGYDAWLRRYGVRNPEDPRHNYDYRRAFEAGVEPTRWRDLPVADREEDLRQVAAGQREPIRPDDYMWPDQFKAAGHPVPAEGADPFRQMQAPKQTFLQRTIDLISRPLYSTSNIVLEAIGGEPGFDPIKAGWKGLTGEAKTTGSDILGAMGIENRWVSAWAPGRRSPPRAAS